MVITEYKPERILSRTVLSLADYVINPYRGCQFGCSYCYVKTFKAIEKRLKKNLDYGNFVDIKINALDLLEEELKINKPASVVLGASTEIYQPVEKKYKTTRGILKLLNKFNVKIYLLTKSDLILRDLDIIDFNTTRIFYTINSTDDRVFQVFENNTPSYKQRINVIRKLKEKNIKVILHIGPVLPGITDYRTIINDTIDYVKSYEFENLNLNSVCKDLFLEKIKLNFLELFKNYKKIFNDYETYNNYWKDLQKDLKILFEKNGKKYYMFYHDVKNYFNNALKYDR